MQASKEEKNRGFNACLLAVCSMAVLSALMGCQAPRSGRQDTSDASEKFLIYNQQIQASVKQLEELLSGSTSRQNLISEGTRRATREAAQSFHRELCKYDEIPRKLASQWENFKPVNLRRALLQCEGLRASVKAQAVRISLAADDAQRQYDIRKLDANLPEAQVDLRPTQDYLAACKRLSTLASSADEYLGALHMHGLRESGKEAQYVARVFHFLNLYHLYPFRLRDLQSPAWDYEVAWQGWLQAEVEKARFDSALEVYLLVLESTKDFRPSSLQGLFDIAARSLDHPLSLQVIQSMEQSLDKIEAVFRVANNEVGEWRVGLQRVRAAMLLCRAKASPDPENVISLAIEARKLDPDLSKEACNAVVKAAQAIGRSQVTTRKYAEGIEAFNRVLTLASVPDKEVVMASFRSEVFLQALKDIQEELAQRRFAEAKNSLPRAFKIAASEEEKLLWREVAVQYYHAQADYFFDVDLQKAIAVCQEGLQVFPSEPKLMEKIDRGRYQLLKRGLGSFETAYRTLGAANILEMLRTAAGAMHTEGGTAACQELLHDLERAWSVQLLKTREASEAYTIALEIAKLNRQEDQVVKAEGARTLSSLLSATVEQSSWSQAERCIEFYFAKCPEAPRPESFKAAYLRFIYQLDSDSDIQRLGRHLTIFATAYPNGCAEIRPIIVKRISAESPQRAGFKALLRTIDPQAEELKDGGADPGEKSDLSLLINQKELAGSEHWWKGSDLKPEARASAADSAAAAGWPGPEGPAAWGRIVGIAGSSVLLVLVPLLSSRKGLLRFRWYALSAFWIGATAGLFLT